MSGRIDYSSKDLFTRETDVRKDLLSDPLTAGTEGLGKVAYAKQVLSNVKHSIAVKFNRLVEVIFFKGEWVNNKNTLAKLDKNITNLTSEIKEHASELTKEDFDFIHAGIAEMKRINQLLAKKGAYRESVDKIENDFDELEKAARNAENENIKNRLIEPRQQFRREGTKLTSPRYLEDFKKASPKSGESSGKGKAKTYEDIESQIKGPVKSKVKSRSDETEGKKTKRKEKEKDVGKGKEKDVEKEKEEEIVELVREQKPRSKRAETGSLAMVRRGEFDEEFEITQKKAAPDALKNEVGAKLKSIIDEAYSILISNEDDDDEKAPTDSYLLFSLSQGRTAFGYSPETSAENIRLREIQQKDYANVSVEELKKDVDEAIKIMTKGFTQKTTLNRAQKEPPAEIKGQMDGLKVMSDHLFQTRVSEINSSVNKLREKIQKDLVETIKIAYGGGENPKDWEKSPMYKGLNTGITGYFMHSDDNNTLISSANSVYQKEMTKFPRQMFIEKSNLVIESLRKGIGKLKGADKKHVETALSGKLESLEQRLHKLKELPTTRENPGVKG